MSSVKINLPILVQNIEVDNKKEYYLKPLFIAYPLVIHRRYERAVSKFQTEVRHIFNGFSVSRDNFQNLLWFCFNPSLTYKVYPMEFSIGKSYIKGSFGVAYFMLKGICYVCLPAFNNYFFIIEPNEKGKYFVADEAEKVIRYFFRQRYKEAGSVEPEAFFAVKGEFISQVEFFVNVGGGKFGFEESGLSFFFSNFGMHEEFIGATELEKVGHDLNERYPAELRRAFYREDLVTRLSNILYQKENSPIVIVGKEGVGKKSILEEAVYRYYDLYQSKVKSTYTLEKVWRIDPTRIIAGMSIVGQWQKRFESILDYIQQRRKSYTFRPENTDKILIDNVVSMLRIGKSSQNDMTLSDVLKPYLEKRLLQVILIATPEEWKVLQEKDRRFADLFQVLRVDEPDKETAAKMVFKQRNLLEIEHGCQIGVPALVQLFSIHRNYLKNRALPGGVVKIIRQLAVKYRFRNVDVEEVRTEFEELSGLHKEIFDDNYLLENDEVRQRIDAQLIGQPDAVNALTDIVHLIKSKLTTANKPLGSFMFIGPTGVGKTQAAKVLSSYLMGNEDQLMRFDMNEFIDGRAVERLIGSPYRPEGQLTGKVRYRPFGVVLLDEIEKANPDVHDLLLQVLDDGRLTDSLGRTVDFSNTIIIMTSNVGAKDVDSMVGYTQNEETASQVYRRAMEKQFRPEFINRIDKVVIFKPLKLEHTFKIARLQINELLHRDGFVRRTTILNIAPEALKWVANRGFNRKMGGRALKRQIEKDLTALSAEQLIKTHSDRPIIFEILFKDNALHPNIITLDFVAPTLEDWLPKLPQEKKGRRFYGQLLNAIEAIERDIRAYEREEGLGHEEEDDYKVYTFGGEDNPENEKTEDEGDGYVDDSNWLYYDFKNKLVERKAKTRETLLGFQNKYYIAPPVVPLRLKHTGKLDPESGNYRKAVMDKIFLKQGMEDLEANYSFNATEFDRVDSIFMDNILDVALLRLAAQAVIKQDVDFIKISFHSYIEGLGKIQIQRLVKLYKELFEGLDISFQLDEEANIFTLEGYHLYELLKGEGGIHLFYIPHQNPLPIRLNIEKENFKAETSTSINVVRVYNGSATVTDLRTNLRMPSTRP